MLDRFQEQAEFLRRADAEMKKQGIPVLDWLHALSPGGDKFGTIGCIEHWIVAICLKVADRMKVGKETVW